MGTVRPAELRGSRLWAPRGIGAGDDVDKVERECHADAVELVDGQRTLGAEKFRQLRLGDSHDFSEFRLTNAGVPEGVAEDVRDCARQRPRRASGSGRHRLKLSPNVRLF